MVRFSKADAATVNPVTPSSRALAIFIFGGALLWGLIRMAWEGSRGSRPAVRVLIFLALLALDIISLGVFLRGDPAP